MTRPWQDIVSVTWSQKINLNDQLCQTDKSSSGLRHDNHVDPRTEVTQNLPQFYVAVPKAPRRLFTDRYHIWRTTCTEELTPGFLL